MLESMRRNKTNRQTGGTEISVNKIWTITIKKKTEEVKIVSSLYFITTSKFQ